MAKHGFGALGFVLALVVLGSTPVRSGNAHVNEAILEAFRSLDVKAAEIRVRDVEFWRTYAPRLREKGRMVEGISLPGARDALRLPLIDEALRSPVAAAGLGLACVAGGPPPVLTTSWSHDPGAPGDDPIPSDVEVPEMVRQLAALLAGLEDAVVAAGVPEGLDARLETWLIEGIEAGDVPAARAEFERYAAAELLPVHERALSWIRQVGTLAKPKARWPRGEPLRIETPRGVVIVGTPTKDVYEEDAWLLVDPGGNDVYRNNAGGTGRVFRSALCVDLKGDDRYESEAPFTQGAARAGVAVLVDLEGDDRYQGASYCQGVGVCGVGLLADIQGRDVFEATDFAQGAAAFGYGCLFSGVGDDSFAIDHLGQGLGRTRGVGILQDAGGKDHYVTRPTHESMYSQWTGGRKVYWSFAQGCGFGFYGRYEEELPDGSKGLVIHDLMPGGIGVLIDNGGDDVYEGSMYAQGTAYFYGLGILADHAGNDSYTATWYGQGAAPHFACGICADGGGNDHYVGMHQVQGNGRDFSTAVFLDLGGDDVYEAEDRVQGCGDRNDAYGIFVDVAGDDRYVAKTKHARGRATMTKPEEQPTAERPYADWGVFLDLGGTDTYEGDAGGADGATWIQARTRRGIGIDR